MLATTLSTLRVERPNLPLLPRAVVEAVLLSEGSIGSADTVARALGLRNRFELARLLKRSHIPSLHRLAEWATVLSWVRRAECDGDSLSKMAFRAHRFPSACYRLIEEVTGMRWSEVLARGLSWLESQFAEELRRASRSN